MLFRSALFSQCGNDRQSFKNTYGTGLFVVASTGDEIPETNELVNTIGWERNGKVEYAVEGSIFIGGSVIQWLRDGLNLINQASDSMELANDLTTNEGVYFVPGLSGLGAPYWNANARGVLSGITRDTSPKEIVRATIEAVAYQTHDLFEEIGRAHV